MPTHQILATEEMVGAGHGTKADTLNRLVNLITAQGDTLYGTAAKTAAALAKGAANTKLFMNAGATAPEWAVGIKVLQITRGLNGVTEDVAYTGVGFKPSAIVFFAAIAATAMTSSGMDDITQQGCIYTNDGDVADSWGITASASIVLAETGVANQAGYVKTMDADGFTITWTRTGGTSAGTINIFCLCLR